MSKKNNTNTYGLFYKSHGTYRPFNNKKTYNLKTAQQIKSQVKKVYKSSVIIRKIKFA